MGVQEEGEVACEVDFEVVRFPESVYKIGRM
jgi:hypothetical protein